MVSRQISCSRTHIAKALALALHEWLLIFMLFVNAIFSYLINKFADYSQLQTPCLLCSRLDHVLGNTRLKHCWDLVCSNHKSEISSLVYSNATIKESNPEICRLLVRKLDQESGSENSSHAIHDFVTSSTRQCICCNQTWAPRTAPGTLLNLSVTDTPKKRIGVDGLVEDLLHKGYPDLKIHSDTEIEAAHTECLTEDQNIQIIDLEPHSITLSNDSAMKRSIDQSPASKPNDFKSSGVPVGVEHVPEEVDGGIFLDHSPMPSEARDQASVVLKESQLVSHDDAPLKSGAQKCQDSVQKGMKLIISLNKIPIASNSKEVPLEFLKENEINPISSTVEVPEESCEAKAIETANVENKELRLYKCEEHVTDATPQINPSPSGSMLHLTRMVTETATKTEAATKTSSSQQYFTQISPKANPSPSGSNVQVPKTRQANPSSYDSGMQVNDLSLQVGDALDLSGAYKIAVANRGRQYTSSVEVEQWGGRVSSRISEEVKALVSQISASTPRIELSPKGMSPKISINSDDLRNFDGLQVLLQKRISLERNESNISLDGIIVGEIEGESEIDRLKRQVEQDKKILTSLLKELDEEKNSSAVAVNQAMSMITRLQEEKAVLQIEALQNLRIAEEEAAYAMEALQKMNDLLFEKEKHILDLDAQLEFYKMKFSKEKLDEPDVPFNAMSNIMKSSLLGFEDEISYIYRCLEKLKKRLQSCTNYGIYRDAVHVDRGENGEMEENNESPLQGDVAFGKKPDMCSLEDEVSEVQERLETLKGAFNFLQQT